MKKREIVRSGVVVMAAAVLSGLVACPVWGQEPENPYAHHTVLVETFVVELTTEAVREAGADIVGRDPAGISISKLLWALRDEDNGRVVSGLKVSAGSGRGTVRALEEITHYFSTPVARRPSPPGEPVQQVFDLRPYTSVKTLSIEWFNIINANSVRLIYSYSENTVIPSMTDAPPAIAKTEFAGNITATPGVPVIAGASQSDDTVRLLVFATTLNAPAAPPADEKQATENAVVKETTSPDTTVQTVTFHKNMPLVDALRMLGEMYKVNVIPSQKVLLSRQPVPVSNLYDVNLEDILQALLGDFHYVIDGTFIRVYTAEEGAAIETKTP